LIQQCVEEYIEYEQDCKLRKEILNSKKMTNLTQALEKKL